MDRCIARAGRVAGLAIALSLALPALGQGNYTLFESGPVRPLALSPDGSKLFVCNIPDGRLEIFDVSAAGLSHSGSVLVGLEPVAVAARTNGEAWVVNQLSDSVSIVDVASQRVVRTLLVGDEPRDIVFAGAGGNRAFITAAHRGQNRPGDPELLTPGVGRADVWVFDASSLGAALGGTPLAILNLFGDTPRALAVTPDRATVYAAAFQSGNQTTEMAQGVLPSQNPPLPLTDPFFGGTLDSPSVGVMLKYQSGTTWVDTNGGTHTGVVQFLLPDHDVFSIDANASPPVQTAAFDHVGTILFNMAVNPVSGDVYVSNTDANNMDRFEGFGTPNLRGELHKARITILSGASVSPRNLNTQIDYAAIAPPASVNAASLGIPTDMAVTSNGATLYLAAFGSGEIGVIDTAALALPPGSGGAYQASAASHIALSAGGPGGVVLDEARGRLYVYTRFDDGVSSVDTALRQEISHLTVHSPETGGITSGRRFLYDTHLTSANGEASCGVCHVFGDFDSLAWDLGDPSGVVLQNTNPFVNVTSSNNGIVVGNPDFHPLKGPMTTQTLRGMKNNGPMHWRGDRTGGQFTNGAPLWDGDPLNAFDSTQAFVKFNPAFVGLLGRANQLTSDEMATFAAFILQVQMPPNPIRNLDQSLTSSQQIGQTIYLGMVTDTVKTCEGCHTLQQVIIGILSGPGSFGTSGNSTFEGETQHFKVPQLRSVYQKVGMFGMPAIGGIPQHGSPTAEQVRGFGLLHDGAVDTLVSFLSGSVFQFPSGDLQRIEVANFVLAIDSDLAPIVGQQLTLTAANGSDSAVLARLGLLVQRAGTKYPPITSAPNECDLVVKGRIAGQPHGWWMSSPGVFAPDVDRAPAISDASLRALAAVAGQELTYTCVPPGSGVRLGIDRGGVGDSSQPDGIGDGSQCGDVSQDGVATNSDVAQLRRWLAGGPAPAGLARCNVIGPGGLNPAQCDILDVSALRRAVGGLNQLLSGGCSPLFTLNVATTGGSNPVTPAVTSTPSGISCSSFPSSDCVEVYASGTGVTLTTGNNGVYQFTGWSGACTGTGPCNLTMDGDKSVTAHYFSL
jgi:YVTN family beta-propeller protein